MKRRTIISVFIGVTIALAGTAIALYKRPDKNPAPVTTDGVAIQDRSTSTTGWKTCTNRDLGYSVSYPPNWHTYGEGSYNESTLYQESECAGKRVLISQYTAEELASGKEPEFIIQYQTVFDLGISRYGGIQSLEEYLARNPELVDGVGSYQSITLDSKHFLWLRSFPQAPLLVNFEEEWLITLSGVNSSEGAFRAMLSTLRFQDRP